MADPEQSKTDQPEITGAAASRGGPFTRFARRRPVLAFVALAYFLGWAMVAPRILSWLGLVSFKVPDWWVAASFYAPCLAALCVHWITQRNLRMVRLCDSLIRLALGIMVGFVLVVVLNTAVPALIADRNPLRTLNWTVFFSVASYHFHYLDPVPPIGEEIGWRGFALPRLQAQYGPVWASVLVGVMWAGFMLPGLALVQLESVGGILLYAITMICLSIEITFAMNLSGFSIIVAAIMHSLASNQTGYVSRMLIAHASPRAYWHTLWALGNLVVPSLLLVLTRGRLGAAHEPEPPNTALRPPLIRSEAK